MRFYWFLGLFCYVAGIVFWYGAGQAETGAFCSGAATAFWAVAIAEK